MRHEYESRLSYDELNGRKGKLDTRKGVRETTDLIFGER
jgi:hypothetical protein